MRLLVGRDPVEEGLLLVLHQLDVVVRTEPSGLAQFRRLALR